MLAGVKGISVGIVTEEHSPFFLRQTDTYSVDFGDFWRENEISIFCGSKMPANMSLVLDFIEDVLV